MKGVVLPTIVFRESPNQSARLFPDGVRLILCHTPEGGYESAINTCLDRSSEVSYHVVVREDGKHATQLVPWSKKAWHGKTYNSASEGVALAGYAASTRALSPGARTMARVVAYRLKQRGLPPRWARNGGGKGFCRHADVQSDRRDPMTLGRWLTFVALVKFEFRRGGFRKTWGVN